MEHKGYFVKNNSFQIICPYTDEVFNIKDKLIDLGVSIGFDLNKMTIEFETSENTESNIKEAIEIIDELG